MSHLWYFFSPSGLTKIELISPKIFQALNVPREWPRFAQALAEAEYGDGSAIADLTGLPSQNVMSKHDPMDNVFGRYMNTVQITLDGTVSTLARTP